MSEGKLYKIPGTWKKHAFIDAEGYRETYQQSVRNPEEFWGKHGKRIDWFTPYSKVKNTSFAAPDVFIKWFEDGVTNVAHNCVDRHLEERGDQTAIIWEGDDPYYDKKISYRELHERCVPAGQCAEEARGQEGRPGHDLHADDPRGGLCDAGLGADRRHPFGGIWRVLAGSAGRADRGLRVGFRHHRR